MYIKRHVIWKDCESGSMLYDTISEKKLLLNDTGTQIFLSKFVKHATDEEIASILHARFKGEKHDEILKDVVSVLNEIYSSDFVTDDCEQRGYINLLEVDPKIDSAIFEITTKCNIFCLHCLEGGSRESKELTTKEIFNLIDELHFLKVYRIVLTGGEPLLRDDLEDIIRRCTEKNIRATVFTNGILVTRELLERIKGLNVLFRFSLDGADAATHDKIRGEGNFEKTVNAMRLCQQLGVHTGIACTINSLNFGQYFDILDLANELGSKETELSEIKDIGNASHERGLLLTQEQLEQMRVNSLEVASKNVSFSKGMGFDRMAEVTMAGSKKRKYSCNAGISTCFISSDGSVFPCMLFKQFEEFNAGNVTKESLSDIWLNSDVFSRMRGLEVTKITPCVGCECFDACPGGCRALAYAQTRKLDGPMDEVFCTTSKNLVRRRNAGEFDHIGKI